MLLIKNKKATFNYEILEKFTAGISLYGFEVKSLKQKKGSFEGSFITIKKNKKNHNELFLKNFYIPPYQEKNTPKNYDKYRLRKLLLQKKEIRKIVEKTKSDKLLIIPISFFQSNRYIIKLDFALARGKKKYDKRESLKKNDLKRNLERDYKLKLKK